MPPSRIAVPLFASLLLAGPVPAEDRKPMAMAATAGELYENPEPDKGAGAYGAVASEKHAGPLSGKNGRRG
jgi:hypothetical protein